MKKISNETILYLIMILLISRVPRLVRCEFLLDKVKSTLLLCIVQIKMIFNNKTVSYQYVAEYWVYIFTQNY